MKYTDYIDATCFTNLDDYNTSFAKKFIAIPNKGDNVEVLYKGKRDYLKVVAIYHCCDLATSVPILRIELHK